MSKFTEYIGSQFGNPRGIVGNVCCLIMNIINKAMYKNTVSLMAMSSEGNMDQRNLRSLEELQGLKIYRLRIL